MKYFLMLLFILSFFVKSSDSLAQGLGVSDSELNEFGVQRQQINQNKTQQKIKRQSDFDGDREIIKSVATPLGGVNIQWYLPEIGETQKNRRTRVIIPGKTVPGSRVFVNSKAIIVITKDNKVGYLPTKKAVTKNPIAIADNDGLFALELDLPNYTVQLPLGVIPPGSKKVTRRYQLNLSVEEEKVRYTNMQIVSKSPAYTKRVGLWFGTGYNYLSFSQESAAINANPNFQSFKGPSAFAKAWMWLSETWDISGTAKMSPGTTTSGTITVEQGSYEWWIYALEGTYYPENLRFDIFETYKAQLAWRFGVQYHLVPFITRTETDRNTATITTNDLTMATAGFKFLIRQHSRFTYELFMRYQYPINSGDTFDIVPKFAFDGSLGAIYEYSNNWRIGLFWYGQWHEYEYSHVDPYRKAQGISSEPITGSTSLIFSNVEVRAGYEFN